MYNLSDLMNKSVLLLGSMFLLGNFTSCASGSEKKGQQDSDTSKVVATVKAEVLDTVKENVVAENENEETPDKAIPTGVRALMKAYPSVVKGWKDNSIVFSDGTTLPYDDGKKKTFDQTLDNADIEDMFSIRYDKEQWQPGYLEDAGRVRNEAFFRKLYGNSQQAVSSKLVPVKWFGQRLRVTSVNGVADSLRAVAAEFAKLPHLHKYLTQASTFYWRKVRGANRLSAHSYGMAVDINTSHSDYWLWKNPGKSETAKIKYANRIPKEVVQVFERHGFIWGGRWYHFDTMHFEFRPDLLIFARLSETNKNNL